MQKFRVAIAQLLVGTDKSVNLQNARNAILSAASGGASLVVLPEIFNG
jgi:predicted amidohydrolase